MHIYQKLLDLWSSCIGNWKIFMCIFLNFFYLTLCWLFGWSLNSQLGFSTRCAQTSIKTAKTNCKMCAHTHTQYTPRNVWIKYKHTWKKQEREKKIKQLKPIEFYLMWLCFVHAPRVLRKKIAFLYELNRFHTMFIFSLFFAFRLHRLEHHLEFVSKGSITLIPFSCFSFVVHSINKFPYKSTFFF